VLPRHHDARVTQPDPLQVSRAMGTLKDAVAAATAAMPGHREYLMAEATRLADAPA